MRASIDIVKSTCAAVLPNDASVRPLAKRDALFKFSQRLDCSDCAGLAEDLLKAILAFTFGTRETFYDYRVYNATASVAADFDRKTFNSI
ncbi:hypothetical protein [Rhizobium sp. BK176]|uniref:hypothetical protein n=1 Tax=Rhizobium sp. BK176 TaxID=2587071 RepID=UPI002167859B|nr:hypothetical protein [Rhizobium sp. BK176]MCS4088470.1 hypothetical protein [Rhizobium sp. BK176]